MGVGLAADPGFLAVIPQVTLVINPVVTVVTFHQTSGYLPTLLGRYQIILLGDRGTQV